MAEPRHANSTFSVVKTGEDDNFYLYSVTFTGKLAKIQARSASPSVVAEIKKWCARKFGDFRGTDEDS